MKLKPVLVVCALALAITAVAGGAPLATPAAPSGLHPFVYRADEPVKSDHTYALMPAFAWNAVRNASSYQLQLATSSVFSEATTLYDKNYAAPVASVQLQLPWMTGKPYALWARVRVVANGRTSSWSSPFGFNTAWQQVPEAPGVRRRSDSLVARPGCHRLRGAVPERARQLPTSTSRPGRTSPTSVSTGRSIRRAPTRSSGASAPSVSSVHPGRSRTALRPSGTARTRRCITTHTSAALSATKIKAVAAARTSTRRPR